MFARQLVKGNGRCITYTVSPGSEGAGIVAVKLGAESITDRCQMAKASAMCSKRDIPISA